MNNTQTLAQSLSVSETQHTEKEAQSLSVTNTQTEALSQNETEALSVDGSQNDSQSETQGTQRKSRSQRGSRSQSGAQSGSQFTDTQREALARSQGKIEFLSRVHLLAQALSESKNVKEARAFANSAREARSDSFSERLALTLAQCKSVKEARALAQALSATQNDSDALSLLVELPKTESATQRTQTDTRSVAQKESETLALAQSEARALFEPSLAKFTEALSVYTDKRDALRDAERVSDLFSGSLSVAQSHSVAHAQSDTQTLTLSQILKKSQRGSRSFLLSQSLTESQLTEARSLFESGALALSESVSAHALRVALIHTESVSESFLAQALARIEYSDTLSRLCRELVSQSLASRSEKASHTRSVTECLSALRRSVALRVTQCNTHVIFVNKTLTEAQNKQKEALSASESVTIKTDAQRLTRALATLTECNEKVAQLTEALTEAKEALSQARDSERECESLIKSLMTDALSVAQRVKVARAEYVKATRALSVAESKYREALALAAQRLSVSQFTERLSRALSGSERSYFNTLAQCGSELLSQAQSASQRVARAQIKTQSESEETDALSVDGSHAQNYSEWLSLYLKSAQRSEALSLASVTELQAYVKSDLKRAYNSPLACINALNRVARTHKSFDALSESDRDALTQKETRALASLTESLSRLSVSKFSLSLIPTDTDSRLCECKCVTTYAQLESAKERGSQILRDSESGALYVLEPLSEYNIFTFSDACLSRLRLSDAHSLALAYSERVILSESGSECHSLREALAQVMTETEAQTLTDALSACQNETEARALIETEARAHSLACIRDRVAQFTPYTLREPLFQTQAQ